MTQSSIAMNHWKIQKHRYISGSIMQSENNQTLNVTIWENKTTETETRQGFIRSGRSGVWGRGMDHKGT